MNTPCENLANAIILRAVEDYRESLSTLRYNPYDKNAVISKDEIERFFHSGWFGVLTKLDPESLIRRLCMEVAA